MSFIQTAVSGINKRRCPRYKAHHRIQPNVVGRCHFIFLSLRLCPVAPVFPCGIPNCLRSPEFPVSCCRADHISAHQCSAVVRIPERITKDIRMLCIPPVITAADGNITVCFTVPVRDQFMRGIRTSEHIDSPSEPSLLLVVLEPDHIKEFRMRPGHSGKSDLRPVRVTVPAPDSVKIFQCPVLLLKPFLKLSLRLLAITAALRTV